MARDIVRSSVETDIYTRKITTSYISTTTVSSRENSSSSRHLTKLPSSRSPFEARSSDSTARRTLGDIVYRLERRAAYANTRGKRARPPPSFEKLTYAGESFASRYTSFTSGRLNGPQHMGSKNITSNITFRRSLHFQVSRPDDILRYRSAQLFGPFRLFDGAC